MQSLNKNSFFFFYDDCSDLEIVPSSLEHGYLCILNEDIPASKKIFGQIDSPRGKWGYAFASILSSYLEEYPSYFQIRNFLEIDLDLLIKNGKIDYIERFLGSLEFLKSINQETYKYTARVMIANNLYSAAMEYMEKSKKLFYNDAELNFMYTKCFLQEKKYTQAYNSVNECLRILPDYYPALVLKKQIEEKAV